jgi:antitoxin component YwqK of YwqJK toxin-antitoxin module
MIHPLQKLFGFFLCVLILAGCGAAPDLVVREFEGSGELVQLQYEGAESPLNLVKEVRFYANGSKRMITPIKEGKVNGVVEYYHPSGHIKESVTFVDGVQNGLYRSYDIDGVLVFEGRMKDGMKQGTWTTWYDEVQKAEEKNYLNDELHGEWTFWYIDGTPKRKELYEHGSLTDQTEY